MDAHGEARCRERAHALEKRVERIPEVVQARRVGLAGRHERLGHLRWSQVCCSDERHSSNGRHGQPPHRSNEHALPLGELRRIPTGPVSEPTNRGTYPGPHEEA